MNVNPFEKAAREWAKGCSCSSRTAPFECKPCTRAYLDHVLTLLGPDQAAGLPEHASATSLEEATGSRWIERGGMRVLQYFDETDGAWRDMPIIWATPG